ncbi:MAG: peroxiredoxin-like family protein [Cyanobacteria bacterium J06632_22]
MTVYKKLQNIQKKRVSDGMLTPVIPSTHNRLLVLLLTQLGDFDTFEYAWWLHRDAARLSAANITARAIGIGNRTAGERFCNYTQFPSDALFIDETAELHQQLELYSGLHINIPGLSTGPAGWLNMMLMCAGIGSPGTLAEVWRGYRGDRQAPQLIQPDETIQAGPLPPLQGKSFDIAGGKGFQRPVELATLRLRNMTEVLSNWNTYIPTAAYLPQRGATFLFDADGTLLYEHRDRGILGFAQNMSEPLAFLDAIPLDATAKPAEA